MTINEAEHLMHLDETNSLQLSATDFVGARVACLGISDSGKTNTAAVLIEELLTNRIPLTIVDIEGEYWGLKEKFSILVAGASKKSDILLSKENAPNLAEISLRRDISIILDLSEYDIEEMHNILLAYFGRLWEVARELRKPYEIILEEAHEFVPQGSRTPLKALLARFALRGRKRGIGMVLASQRSAKVEKDLLTQADLLFLHKVVHPIDLNIYKELIPRAPKEIEQVRGFVRGEVFFVRGERVERLRLRLRQTYHVGATPTLDEHQPQLRPIDATLLQELRTIAAPAQPDESEVARLTRKLREAEAVIAAQKAEIAELQRQLAIIATLRVEMSSDPLTEMHIAHATVGNVSTAASLPNFASSQPGLLPTSAEPIEPIYLAINESKLRALFKWFKKNTTFLHRKMLQVLYEHSSEMLNAYEIAAWCECSENTIKDHPPLELIQRGILRRIRYQDGYHYQSQLLSFLSKEFPGTDPKLLENRVCSELFPSWKH